jgi:hypothetical protein
MDKAKTQRKPYCTPKLTVYGDIAAVTHGKGKGGKGGGHGGGGHGKGHGKLRS